jgi:hypothetical protein
VAQVSIIPAEEAGVRMGTLLGAQADMLAHLEENPFRSFLELRISLDSLASILGRVEAMPLVELVRDNRDVLDRLMGVERALRLAGLVFGVAVSLFTVVLMSHITRIGVVHNREQIRTLRLLGAPERHIAPHSFFWRAHRRRRRLAGGGPALPRTRVASRAANSHAALPAHAGDHHAGQPAWPDACRGWRGAVRRWHHFGADVREGTPSGTGTGVSG